MRFVDVGAVQAMPSSAGALFQVASNFNGIEGISSQAHPDRASYATDWHYDYTQGPRASIFAGAAAMARIFAPWAYPLPLMETDAPQDYATATAAAAAAGMSSDNTSGSNGRATPLPSRKQVYESVVEAAIDDDSNERAAVLFGAQGAYIPTEASAAWPAPGPRLRMYLGTPTGAALARRAAQTRGRQVQALGALAKDFPTRNGYVILPKNGHAQQQDGEADDAGGSESFPTESDADRARWEEKLGRVRVMCHRRCTVTFDSVPGQPDALRVLDAHTLVPGEDCAQVPAVVGHEIDQVFAAALNVREPNSDNAADTPLVARKRRFLLQAAYEGTYLAAKEGNNQELYLTLVGGGVFRNPFSEVFAAMAAAHARWAPGTALRKVVLLLFTPDQNIISGVMAALKGQGIGHEWVHHEAGQRQVRASWVPTK